MINILEELKILISKPRFGNIVKVTKPEFSNQNCNMKVIKKIKYKGRY